MPEPSFPADPGSREPRDVNSASADSGREQSASSAETSAADIPAQEFGDKSQQNDSGQKPEDVADSEKENTANGDAKDSASLPHMHGENSAKPAGQDIKGNQEKEDDQDGSQEKSMALMDHLSELRQRLTKSALAAALGFAICWIFVDPLFNILMDPLLAVLPEGTHAQYTTLPEAFFTRMRVAFVAGVFLASPIIFYQIWAFVAPGLYDEEKRHILPIAFLSAIFFISGGLFCYYIVFPFAFNFFISYSTPEIVITPKISDYLSFCLKLIFAFGLIFEMPIFTFFLARLGIITANMMRRGRKYAIVGIFILAAILTPPDVVSQILMACPMLILYEASIGVAAIFGKKRQTKQEEEDEDNA